MKSASVTGSGIFRGAPQVHGHQKRALVQAGLPPKGTRTDPWGNRVVAQLANHRRGGQRAGRQDGGLGRRRGEEDGGAGSTQPGGPPRPGHCQARSHAGFGQGRPARPWAAGARTPR